jgi:hypothetical protein
MMNRPRRAAAAAAAVLALTTTATVALVTTASADEPGRCLENVNVREKPDVNSRIVALCEAGTQVQVGETRSGFVRLTDLGGWASQQYVAVNGRSPAPAASEQDSPSPGMADEGSTDETQPETEQGSGQETGQEESGNSGGGGAGGPLGGLLG